MARTWKSPLCQSETAAISQSCPNEKAAEYVRRYPKRFVGADTVNRCGGPMGVLGDIGHMASDLHIYILRLES
jgi:predicted TIM-barrel fold metal-dependent hydrolase